MYVELIALQIDRLKAKIQQLENQKYEKFGSRLDSSSGPKPSKTPDEAQWREREERAKQKAAEKAAEEDEASANGFFNKNRTSPRASQKANSPKASPRSPKQSFTDSSSNEAKINQYFHGSSPQPSPGATPVTAPPTN